VCSNPAKPDGTTCNDGNSQTTNDRCQTGTCEGDLPPASVCGNGIIEAGETCDDGNLLNGDGCSSTCQDECVNPATDCPLSDQQCEVAACVATTGGGARCKINNRPNGTACNDGSTETSPDQCYQGDCVGGFAYPTCAPVSCEPWACGTSTIVGTSKNETISGTIGDDVIAGNGGNDAVKAMEGDDCVTTGSGKDKVEGQKGHDKIIDLSGTNTLNGGEGNDCIFGGSDSDKISGDDGCDVLYGSDGADTIEGRWGGDVIIGGSGNDKISGHEGSDLIYGGEGNDTIDGGSEGGDIDSCDGGPGTDMCKNCEVTINCEIIK
jgi:cysteine-rich repeat protein